MSAIFASNTVTPTVWQTQRAAIVIQGLTDSGKGPGLFTVATSVSVRFTRAQNVRYPIGQGSAPIKLQGAAAGSVTLGTLIGPTAGIKNFLQVFSDGVSCKPFKMTIKTATANKNDKCAGDASPQQLVATGCTGVQLDYSMQQGQQGLSIATGTFTISITGLQWASN